MSRLHSARCQLAAVNIVSGPRRRRSRVTILIALALGALAIVPAYAQADFQLGFQDAGFQAPLGSTSSRAADAAMGAIHGSTIRLDLPWANVAPGGTTMPSGFDPSNPADPAYNWTREDLDLRLAAQRHLRVVLTLISAPAWAQPPGEPAMLHANYPGVAWDPSAADFAKFVRAAALRYGGHFPDPLHPGTYLPRVTDWEIWNEENLPLTLVARNPVEEYRSLLNAAYGALKSVSPSNVVAVGGLAPVSFIPPTSVPPLTFAADLMCLKPVGAKFVRSGRCPRKADFDVFSIHPYSLAATPTKHASDAGDVLVGDMGKVKSLVQAADALHTVAPGITHQIWVTEWSWFTNPPQAQVGDPDAVAARYVAYSMYEMWHSGVSLVIWFTVEDEPGPAAAQNPSFINGGGLYTSSGKPKLTLRAFGFPVVASVSRRHGFVWGRAPVSRPVQVVVERMTGRRWKALGTARTGSDGVFYYGFPASKNGTYRAVVVHGPTSLAYNSTAIPPKRTHDFSTG